MAVERLSDEKTVEEKSYDKVRRDMDIDGPSHKDHKRKLKEHDDLKAKLKAREQGK